MATFTIDLTGAGGLANNFAGDLNDTAASPNKRYGGSDTQFADGIFNPIKTAGYISPANNKYADLTGTITAPFISRAYASATDTFYLAQKGLNLSTVSGLDGTVVASTSTLAGTSEFRDLELYEINGEEALYYSYRYTDASTSNVSNANIGWKSLNSDKGAFQLAARVFDTFGTSNTADVLISAPTSTSANQKLAQSFRTQDTETYWNPQVTGIRLRLKVPYVGTSQVWTAKASIQTDSAGFPSGTIVTNASATVNAANLSVGGYSYVYFTFSTPVTLTADTTYHVVLEPTVYADLGANEGVDWLSTYGSTSLYANGRTEKYDGTTWTQASYTSESFDFALVLNQYNFVDYDSVPYNIDPGSIQVGTNQNSGYTASGTSVSYSQTTTANALPCVIVAIRVFGITDILTAANFDGAAMTLISKRQTSVAFVDSWLYLYRKVGMTAGSHTVAVTTSGAAKIVVMSGDYYNVEQTTTVSGTGSATTGGGTAASLTGNVSIARNGGVAVALAVEYISNPIVAGSGQRRSQNASETSSGFFDSATAQAAGTFGMTVAVTGSDTYIEMIYASLQPPLVSTPSSIVPSIYEPDDVSNFLKKADNGFLYWFVGNKVHKIGGGTESGDFGEFTQSVLEFPSYLKTVDAIDTNALMYIGVQSSAPTTPDYRNFNADILGVYIWDRLSSASGTRNFIPIYGARELKKIFVNADGDIRVITIGEDRFTEIRGISNGKLVVLKRLGLNAYPAYRDSVDVVNNMVMWLGADGVTYAYGKITPGAAEAVYKIGTISGEVSGTLTSGIFMAGNKESTQSRQGVFISWNDSGGNTLTKWYPHGQGTINSVAQTGNQGDVYSMVAFLPTLSDVHSIDVICLPNGAAGDATAVGTLKFYRNQATTPFMTKTVKRSNIVKGYLSYEINTSYTTALQVELEWSTSQTLGSNDFQPAYAVVNYTPTATRKSDT